MSQPGTGYGEKSAERLAQRNVYCERDWQPRAGAADFVPRNPWQHEIGRFAVDHMEIGVADGAGVHAHKDPVGAGSRIGTLFRLQRLTRLMRNHREHAAPSGRYGIAMVEKVLSPGIALHQPKGGWRRSGPRGSRDLWLRASLPSHAPPRRDQRIMSHEFQMSSVAAPDFAALFTALPHACLVFTPDLVIVAATDAYLRLTGTERHAIVGCDLFAASPDNPLGQRETEIAARASIVQAIETKRPQQLFRQRYDILTRHTGLAALSYEQRYWNVTYHPVVGPDDAVRWVIQSVLDVTQEVQGERSDSDRLRSAEDRLAATFDQYAVGMVTVSITGRILEANQRFSDLLGMTMPELQKRTIRDITHPDDIANDLRAEAALTAGTVPHTSLEKRYVRPDGSTVWVNASRALVRSSGGNAAYFVTVVEDISTRKAAEVAVKEQEAYLRSILDTVPDGMIVIDERGIIHSFSRTAEALFDFRAEEVIGRNVSILMPSPDRQRHDSYIRGYVDTAIPRIIGFGRAVTGCRKDGSRFSLHLSIGEIRMDSRRMFVGFTRDLTERERAEARLQSLQSELVHMSRFTALGEMASALAHELNQPLTAATNYLKGARRILEQGTGDRPLLVQAVEEASTQTLRAGQIIRRLRDFVARGESERKSEDVCSLVQEASALALIGAEERGVRVFFGFDPDVHTIYADRIQVQQVLLNLIRNALEAMQDSERRELTIATTAKSSMMVEISIRDTGPGLAPEIAARLFQPFVTTKPTGMGVGLSICRTIVEAHEGEISAVQNADGGTTFRVTLPAHDSEEAADD